MPLRLKSRTQSPPNGFRYEQKETGWRSWAQVPHTQWDFSALCNEIRNHRLANAKLKLSLVPREIEEEVDLVNAQRVLAITGAESYVVDGGASLPKTVGPASLAQVVAAGKAAPKILVEWLGDGLVTVVQELAEKRAAVCVQCPLNSKEGLTRYFTEPAAALIKKTVALKNGLAMKTSQDKALGICKGCLCELTLKCWVPVDVIKNHTSPEVIEKLKEGNKSCWILSEIK